MDVALVGDLGEDELSRLLPDRPLRAYPAALSSEADALAWARAGAESGSLVVAEYQASPRGRGGIEWTTPVGEGFVFSLILRPESPTMKDGWLYLAACLGIADALEQETSLVWPEEVWVGGQRAAAIALQVDDAEKGVQWAVVTVLVERARPPRAPLLARVVQGIEARCAAQMIRVVSDYRKGCSTIGTQVRARLVPMGPAGKEVVGEAVAVFPDGSLVVQTEGGRRAMVPPGTLGILEPASAAALAREPAMTPPVP